MEFGASVYTLKPYHLEGFRKKVMVALQDENPVPIQEPAPVMAPE